MDAFIQNHHKHVIGVLSGWDRLLIRGTQRALANVAGMMTYLSYMGLLLKSFGAFVEETSRRVRQASEETARRLDRPIRYLPSTAIRKEEVARQIAQEDGIQEGLICLLACVEPCIAYLLRSDRAAGKLTLELGLRKCLHLYHYWIDKDFGLMHGRLQTWFPFTIQVCLNGRSWLSRQMDKQGLGYVQQDNCFPWLEDVAASQRRMDERLTFHWPQFLRRIAHQLHPLQQEILSGYRTDYYWSVYESEWATDIMFDSPQALAQIYPSLVRGAITTFSSKNVMRFLGKKPSGPFQGEVVSSYLRRPEGVRIKHAVKSNSVKMYDKHGRILRIETTMNNPYDFKAYRPKESDPQGPRSWRYLRKGIADFHRRAQICQGVNTRYLQALASFDTEVPVKQLVASVCQPARWKRRRLRPLRPWSARDQKLLTAISRGE